MPERLTSISKARSKLPRLSQAAQKRLDRYIITLQGQPQSVLIGYDEYQSMKATVELMRRPEVIEDIKAGLKELDEGKGVPLSEMKARVHDAIRLRETNKLAEELAVESGVDSSVIETVMGHFGQRMMDVFSTNGRMFVPGVGEIEMICQVPVGDAPGKVGTRGILYAKPQVRTVLLKKGVLKKKIGRGVKATSAKRQVMVEETEKES